MAKAYYNEIDPFAVKWLKNLIAGGHLPPGDVDDRSIKDVQGSDLNGYTQCHFFAGIGGWPYALQLAGWPTDRPVWTGSCPCQPFSAAGNGKSASDNRHLWPDFYALVAKCRPSIVFGEQVERAIRHGWLDAVCNDLEDQGYSVASAVLPACCVGAMHEGSRLWWLASSEAEGFGRPRRGSIPVSWSQDELERLVRQEVRISVPAGSNGGLSDGLSRGVAGPIIKGFGNAIVPQLAAEFIQAGVEAINDACS